jgi:hypothetical protein
MSAFDELWQRLTSFSDTYTCYSSAVATWIAHGDPEWVRTVNSGLSLTLTDAGDSLFGFVHFPPSLRPSLGLSRRGSDDVEEAVAGILDELDRSGRVIVAGDGFHLPWHVAFERRHVPHWFTLAAAPEGPTVLDPFACRNELGWQHAAVESAPREILGKLVVGLPHDDPVFRLRESLALGDYADPLDGCRFRWVGRDEVGEVRVPEGAVGPDAVLRLARHFRENGQRASAYRQADDLWSVARHRAFLARRAAEVADGRDAADLGEWVNLHAAPLARRWGHMAPLLMQATLALEAGRDASAGVPDTLEELAEREAGAAEAFPVGGALSPVELEP